MTETAAALTGALIGAVAGVGGGVGVQLIAGRQGGRARQRSLAGELISLLEAVRVTAVLLRDAIKAGDPEAARLRDVALDLYYQATKVGQELALSAPKPVRVHARIMINAAEEIILVGTPTTDDAAFWVLSGKFRIDAQKLQDVCTDGLGNFM